MNGTGRINKVAFIDARIKKAYDELKKGRHEGQQLATFLDRAVEDLKCNPFCGIRIPSKLWPKEYKKYGIPNLLKYDLPDGWRLIYTVKENEVEIVAILLEWFNHKDYERRFGY